MGVARSIAIVAAGLIASCTQVRAECLTPLPPCEALKRNAVVVLADVLDARIRTAEGPPKVLTGPVDIRLRVLERFKGVPKDQSEIKTSISLNAETIIPNEGQTFLVYADLRPSGNWDTACTRTRRANGADDEVRVLRECR